MNRQMAVDGTRKPCLLFLLSKFKLRPRTTAYTKHIGPHKTTLKAGSSLSSVLQPCLLRAPWAFVGQHVCTARCGTGANKSGGVCWPVVICLISICNMSHNSGISTSAVRVFGVAALAIYKKTDQMHVRFQQMRGHFWLLRGRGWGGGGGGGGWAPHRPSPTLLSLLHPRFANNLLTERSDDSV